MTDTKKQISSGINGLNRMLNGLYIGDNVVWYDDAGSLASEFCLKFVKESQDQNKPIVYVSFDRSPKNLIEKLGPLAQNQQLTILDCFTNGKGDKAQVFNKFYEKDGAQWPYHVIKVTRPDLPQAVSDAVYGLHKTLTGNVRFVFESLTGMADLWEGEDHILKFYSHTCPQLYELDTIAYWIIEKAAHSSKLKAHINQIAQVAIDLSITQGKTKIKILKAENRSPKALGKSSYYTIDGNTFIIEDNYQEAEPYNLGSAIKNFRKNQGMSQKELSFLVGVTPSNISQIESNQVFPSIPALYKIANHLSVDVGSFFKETCFFEKMVFSGSQGIDITLPGSNIDICQITQLTPFDLNGKIELFLIKFFPEKKLSSHFFQYKGAEAGYLLSGKLDMICQDQNHHLEPGDSLYLKTASPTKWQNQEKTQAIMLWIKIL
ncbi:MAG: helix-turn-helix domain-containing protein [Pseudomonadota bacterium]